MCYTKEGALVDRREMLRIKVKSLADEARFIRKEEQRTFGSLKDELQHHRRGPVRDAARKSHMAYAMIKGKDKDVIEKPKLKRTPEFWNDVRKMIGRYGPLNEQHKAELLERCTG